MDGQCKGTEVGKRISNGKSDRRDPISSTYKRLPQVFTQIILGTQEYKNMMREVMDTHKQARMT